MELEWNACVMVTSNSPTFWDPPFPMGQDSSPNPLLPSQRYVSKLATIFGLCFLASSRRSPKWSECPCVRKITSRRATFFNAAGHTGFVITHGSISDTCPDGVITEKVLCPKYVM